MSVALLEGPSKSRPAGRSTPAVRRGGGGRRLPALRRSDFSPEPCAAEPTGFGGRSLLASMMLPTTGP
eukprot:3560788-Alexandrium_andersonii.AAC.1